jgi:hypothetical protein
MMGTVYYAETDSYPNTKKQQLAHMFTVALHQGDAMTWVLLDDVNQYVICHSAMHTALDHSTPNLHAEQRFTLVTPGLRKEQGKRTGQFTLSVN